MKSAPPTKMPSLELKLLLRTECMQRAALQVLQITFGADLWSERNSRTKAMHVTLRLSWRNVLKTGMTHSRIQLRLFSSTGFHREVKSPRHVSELSDSFCCSTWLPNWTSMNASWSIYTVQTRTVKITSKGSILLLSERRWSSGNTAGSRLRI